MILQKTCIRSFTIEFVQRLFSLANDNAQRIVFEKNNCQNKGSCREKLDYTNSCGSGAFAVWDLLFHNTMPSLWFR